MRTHRNVVLADLPEAERAIADKALQGGIPAVRTAVAEQNAQLRSQGKEEVPAAGLLKMAEELLPRLRVAEWLDRAEAAKADIDELDLRDLRSVVVGADDPMVARDETTRAIAAELKAALLTRQEQASAEWLEDISMAVEVGRVIRALKLSSEPPKAGMRFPTDLAARLAGAATASLAADALPERWSAVLEAAAFSPIRAQIAPAAPPTQVNDELTATITRLAAAVPQIAALFGITVAPGTQAPKPLRPTRKPDGRKGPGAPTAGPTNAQGRPLPPKPLPPKPLPPKPVAVAPTVESPVIESDSAEPPVIESPVIESPVIESPVIESPVIESGSAETEAAPPVVEVVALEAEAVTGDAADAEDDSPGVEAGSDEVEAETTDEADSIEATDAADEATEAASIEVTDAADEVSETIDGIAADAADSEQVADAS